MDGCQIFVVSLLLLDESICHFRTVTEAGVHGEDIRTQEVSASVG